MCAVATIGRWAHAAVDLITGRRAEVRNRLKFLLLSPIYDAFYVVVPVDPHGEITRRLPAGARRVLDLCTGTALVPAAVAAARPDACVVGLDLSWPWVILPLNWTHISSMPPVYEVPGMFV